MLIENETSRNIHTNLSEKLTRLQEDGLVSPFLVNQFITKKVRRQTNDYRSY